MKKLLVGFTVVGILIIALGLVGFAYARNQADQGSDTENSSWHNHMAGFRSQGHGMMDCGNDMMEWDGDHGPMHESMVAAFSEAIGLGVEEIENRHDAGETLWEIAEAQGLSPKEIQDLMSSVHDAALADAVANGWLTEEHAGWMHQMEDHMHGRGSGDFGHGGHCGGGMFYESPHWDTDS